MVTDGHYLWPIIESLRKHKGPHHLYYFDYLGEHSFQEILAGRRVLTGKKDLIDCNNVKDNLIV